MTLRHEDFETLEGCTPLQLEHAELWDKHNSQGVLDGRLRRPFLSLGALPRRRHNLPQAWRDLELSALSAEQPIVPHQLVDIVSLHDRPDRPGTGKAVEIVALVQSSWLDESGLPNVGGTPEHLHQLIDFSLGPIQPPQGGDLEGPGRGHLLATRVGAYTIRRLGKDVDLCVGTLSSPLRPAIQYRLKASLFAGENPAATLPSGLQLPALGQSVQCGRVVPGRPLATLHREVRYTRVQPDERGKVIVVAPEGRRMSAGQEQLFALLNVMNDKQTARVLSQDLTPIASQLDWSWDALVLFPEELAEQFTMLQEFQTSPALEHDFLKAVGTQGDFHLRADVGGTVSHVDFMPGQMHLKQVRYTSGARQVFPASASFFKILPEGNGKSLDPGDEVVVGELIAHACPRTHYDWHGVEMTLGVNLQWMLNEFMLAQGLRHAASNGLGAGALVSLRYVGSILDRAVRDEQGQPRWCWDFRRLDRNNFVDGGLICPVIRFEDWRETQLAVRGVTYHLGKLQGHIRTWQPVTAVVEPVAAPLPVEAEEQAPELVEEEVRPRTPWRKKQRRNRSSVADTPPAQPDLSQSPWGSVIASM